MDTTRVNASQSYLGADVRTGKQWACAFGKRIDISRHTFVVNLSIFGQTLKCNICPLVTSRNRFRNYMNILQKIRLFVKPTSVCRELSSTWDRRLEDVSNLDTGNTFKSNNPWSMSLVEDTKGIPDAYRVALPPSIPVEESWATFSQYCEWMLIADVLTPIASKASWILDFSGVWFRSKVTRYSILFFKCSIWVVRKPGARLLFNFRTETDDTQSFPNRSHLSSSVTVTFEIPATVPFTAAPIRAIDASILAARTLFTSLAVRNRHFWCCESMLLSSYRVTTGLSYIRNMVEIGCEWSWKIDAGDELFPSPDAICLG